MDLDERDSPAGAPVDRRRIVKAGAKLAYAAPLVAASFKLAANGALAQRVTCPAGYDYVPVGPSGHAECCHCPKCTATGVAYDPKFKTCVGTVIDKRSGKKVRLSCGKPICVPVIQSL